MSRQDEIGNGDGAGIDHRVQRPAGARLQADGVERVAGGLHADGLLHPVAPPVFQRHTVDEGLGHRLDRERHLRVADLELDLLAHTATRAGEPVRLQPREFRLLEYLMKHAGRVVTRTMLLENVWDYHFDPQTNVIDVHISRLRAKIDRGEAQPLLHTVRGSGYLLGTRG